MFNAATLRVDVKWWFVYVKYTSIILTYYNITFYSSVPLSHDNITGSQYPEPKAVKWKLVINHSIIYTCGFPTFPWQNVVKESCLWVTTRTWIGQFPFVDVVFYECEEVVMDGDCEKWSFQKVMLINLTLKSSVCAQCVIMHFFLASLCRCGCVWSIALRAAVHW